MPASSVDVAQVDVAERPPATSDEDRRRALRRMKAVAAGLLGLAALVYLVTLTVGGANPDGALGYVQAGSEAAMVGALADWFAVTALFRRPLGLPIPHTALIPTRKDQMGATLGDFVGTNFLTDDVVRDKVGGAQMTRRVGIWLADEEHARALAGELGRALRGLLAVLDEDRMRTMIERVIRERVERTEISTGLGQILGRVVADRAHAGIVDVLADRLHAWLAENQATVQGVIGKQAPTWTPRFVDEIVSDRIYFELVRFIHAVRDEPDHEVRAAIDRMLTQFAEDLHTNDATRQRVEQAKVELYEHPDVQRSISQVWATAQRVILEAADDPSSELRTRAAGELAKLGQTLARDPALQESLDNWVTDTVVSLVADYRDELTSVITDTVARWDGKQTADRIELAAGRDLQFIRINGTVVGALAGLAIHAASGIIG